MAGWFWDVEMSLVIELPIVEGPVFGLWPVKEGEFLFHLVDGLEDEWVARGGVCDFVHQGYVDSL